MKNVLIRQLKQDQRYFATYPAIRSYRQRVTEIDLFIGVLRSVKKLSKKAIQNVQRIREIYQSEKGIQRS